MNGAMDVTPNSSKLTNNVIIECDRIGRDLMSPFLNLNARLFSITLLSIFFVILNPLVALICLLTLGGAYLLVFRIARTMIGNNGKYISTHNKHRIKLLQESYDGIKDIKLTGTETIYENDYASHTNTVSLATANNLVLSQAPYYIIEGLAFTGMIAISLYFITTSDGLGNSFAILGLYAMIGYRLIPLFQRSYLATATIKGALPAFDNVKEALRESLSWKTPDHTAHPIHIHNTISLSDISFSYPEHSKTALSNVSLTISTNTITVFTGPSGAGKSTLIDILLGLLIPDSGSLKVDNTEINPGNIQAWQKSIGYVPQQIHIADNSLMENIAFGIPLDKIDIDMVKSAALHANIESLANEREMGYQAILGEKGKKLSGGQKQRIGIARAIYRNPDVLILDEPTSALDKETEQKIIESLKTLSNNMTIVVISHSQALLDSADNIFRVNNGNIINNS